MTVKEAFEYLAEVKLRRMVRKLAKANPNMIDYHTYTFANGKRYLIRVWRNDKEVGNDK